MVEIDVLSQPYVLALRGFTAQLTHDQRALVDIAPVRVEKWNGKSILFFCPTEKIIVKKTLQPGDGEPLPLKVVFNNLPAPRIPFGKDREYYCLKNVIIHSNGVISITPTAQTEWVKWAEVEESQLY